MTAARAACFLALFAVLAAPAAALDDRDVVKVNGTPIRQSEVMERLWQRYGPQTLDDMVNELLVRQAVEKSGIAVSPKEVDARVEKLRATFPSEALFESQLKQSGSSIDELRADLSKQLAAEKLVVRERKLGVTEDELREAFNDHKDELGLPEAVHLRHILVATKADADDILAQLKKGVSFPDLAREKSLAPTGKLNGGDYGFVAKGMLPPEIEAVAFSMKPGEVRVLPGDNGVHILQALERRKAVPASYAKVKGELKDLVLREKVRQAMPGFIKELRDKADIEPQGT